VIEIRIVRTHRQGQRQEAALPESGAGVTAPLEKAGRNLLRDFWFELLHGSHKRKAPVPADDFGAGKPIAESRVRLAWGLLRGFYAVTSKGMAERTWQSTV